MEKYRIYKYLSVEEREAGTTAAYSDIPRSSPTNVTSDQTANIAIYNVDSQAYREEYCKRVGRAVKRMPKMESFLIESRYMTKEYDYITDQRGTVLCFSHRSVSQHTGKSDGEHFINLHLI
ncbi:MULTISPECIES: hypothetical protein [Paenibacillus]|uniref:hypothetical protein n=1 Tax=Paenibacillus TaxID=44249 RepID=UPI001FD7DFA8|nr:hypothetical protein [Paenibacillus peoriae]